MKSSNETSEQPATKRQKQTVSYNYTEEDTCTKDENDQSPLLGSPCNLPKNNKVEQVDSTEVDKTTSEVHSSDINSKGSKNSEPVVDESISDQNNISKETSPPNTIRWPWIPLFDSTGRQYFYNALTSKTSWTCTTTTEETIEKKNDLLSENISPPSTFTAASAQQVWQNYWIQCQEAQKTNNLSRRIPGLSEPPPATAPPSSNKSNEDKSSGSGSRSIAASMTVYIEHNVSPSAKQLARPARQQVRPPNTEAIGYTQGFEEYNIWYGKHLSDRNEGGSRREDREKATTRCNPFTDSGYTRCDMEPQLDRPVICLYYAKGCCYLGSNCRYYHRLPTVEDDERLDILHDIFGRERFAAHRDDMDGVGTFSEDCRTLFIGDLKVNRVFPNAEEKTEQLIRQQFGLWGPLEDIRVIRNKNIAFIRYKYRVHAEFAKVAMSEQRLLLDRPDDQICVRWAHPGKGAGDKSEEQNARDWETANKALMKRLQHLGYTQDDLECYIRWEIQNNQTNSNMDSATDTNNLTTVTDLYPNTDARIQEGLTASLNDANTSNPIPLAFSSNKLQLNSAETQPQLGPASYDDWEDSVLAESAHRMGKVLSRIDQMGASDASFTVDI